MANPAFSAGATLTATSFKNDTPFKITITSSAPVSKGSTAVVLAGQAASGGLVALKIFTNTLDDHQTELLRRELHAARQVHHRFILPFMGMATSGFHTILISPLMKNGNLLQFLQANSEADRRISLVEVATAVDHLHTRLGLVHGDLKCENILVSEDGHALLADFGLSTFIDKAESSTTTATSVRQRSTIQFAAPELIFDGVMSEPTGNPDGARPRSKTPKTDVYAFGMLMLQAFTEKPPWPGVHPSGIMWKVYSRETHPRPDASVYPRFDDDWWSACVKCWAYHPSDRPTIHEVWEGLTGLLSDYRIFREHTGAVTCLSTAWSGTRVVSGSSDGSVRIWDVGSEHILAARSGHTGGAVHAVAVSPNGRQVAYVNTEHEIRLWNPAWSAAIQTSPIFLAAERFVEIVCIAYSPHGDYLGAGYGNGSVQVWETATRTPVRKPVIGHEGVVSAVAFSPDGCHIASASHDKTICIWYMGEGYNHAVSQRATLRGHDSRVTSVCFSHDGTRVISGSGDRTVRVWGMQDGVWQVGHVLRGHDGWVNAVACAPSGTLVASASDDSTVRVWDTATGKLVGEPFRGHRGFALAVAFVRGGTGLASGSGDKTIRFWNLSSLAASMAAQYI